ncbi:MAG: DUF2752 domain-containing protein [Bergeyella sp.]
MEDSVFLKCPFKTITGYDCPGCGSQHAIHELLHLNIGKAFRYNPLLVVMIPYFLLFMVFQIKSVKNRFPKINKLLFGQNAVMILFIIILLFFIFRNL